MYYQRFNSSKSKCNLQYIKVWSFSPKQITVIKVFVKVFTLAIFYYSYSKNLNCFYEIGPKYQSFSPLIYHFIFTTNTRYNFFLLDTTLNLRLTIITLGEKKWSSLKLSFFNNEYAPLSLPFVAARILRFIEFAARLICVTGMFRHFSSSACWKAGRTSVDLGAFEWVNLTCLTHVLMARDW